MKIRKTRIKKVTKANGSIKYIPEYKWGLWWYKFVDVNGPCSRIYVTFLECYSEAQAKEAIDHYINNVKYKNACIAENKTTKVEYQEYP